MDRHWLRISLLGALGAVSFVASLLAVFACMRMSPPRSETPLTVNPVPPWASDAQKNRPSKAEQELERQWRSALSLIAGRFAAHMSAHSIDVTVTRIDYVVAEDCYRIRCDWQKRSTDDRGTDTLVLRRRGDEYSALADSGVSLKHELSIAAWAAQSFTITLPVTLQPVRTFKGLDSAASAEREPE